MDCSRTRSRGDGIEYPVVHYTSKTTSKRFGGTSEYDTLVSGIREGSQEVTLDSVHANYPNAGGDFSNERYSMVHSPGDMYNKEDYIKLRYVRTDDGYVWQDWGTLYEDTGSRYVSERLAIVKYPPPLTTSWGAANALGPSCWGKFSPSAPKLDLAAFFGELFSGLGMFSTNIARFRKLGSSYLEAQFGWIPFLNDIATWFDSLRNLDKQVESFIRNNGQWVRRSGTVFSESEETVTDLSAMGSPNLLAPYQGADIMYAEHKAEYTKKAWYTGMYRYYIPGLNGTKIGKLKAVQELWNLEITPDTVWQLLPFSWLVDWFSDVGAVVTNCSMIEDDSLTTKYAYVMLSEKVECTTKVMYKDDGGTKTSKLRKSYTNKYRAKATPFGFNVDMDNLSPYRNSILAALGLSRLGH